MRQMSARYLFMHAISHTISDVIMEAENPTY